MTNYKIQNLKVKTKLAEVYDEYLENDTSFINHHKNIRPHNTEHDQVDCPNLYIRKATIIPSNHAQKRLQQRSIPNQAILLAFTYGRQIAWNYGSTLLYLGQKEIECAAMEEPQMHQTLEKLVGLTMIQSTEGEVITVYRNPRGISGIIKSLRGRRQKVRSVASSLKGGAEYDGN